MDARRSSPACQRNRAPILDVLRRVLPDSGRMLEIAAGTGEHALYFSTHLPGWRWQPTERADLASISAWREVADGDNLLAPIELDVTRQWPLTEPVDAVFNANMIHISPWACCEGLMRGAATHLEPGGHLVTYGPYKVDGKHTSDSNESFDQNLKSRDPAWGIRDLEAVADEAATHGLELRHRIQMPANNFTLVFVRV